MFRACSQYPVRVGLRCDVCLTTSEMPVSEWERSHPFCCDQPLTVTHAIAGCHAHLDVPLATPTCEEAAARR
jgi:hypothetical protein